MTVDFQDIIDRLNNNDETLVKLDLTNKGITQPRIEALASALAANHTLKELILKSNNIDDDGVEKLCEGLKTNHTLKILRLGHNNIKFSGAACIAELLLENKALEKLELHKNKIRGAGAEALMEALQTNSTLKHLNLKSNHILSYAGQPIAEMLQKNKTLISLELADNGLDNDALSLIADAVEQSQSLKMLDIRAFSLNIQNVRKLFNSPSLNNLMLSAGLYEEDLIELFEILGTNTTIRSLWFEGMKFGEESIDALCKALESNRTLERIHMPGCWFYEWPARPKIEKALEVNSSLRVFSLPKEGEFAELQKSVDLKLEANAAQFKDFLIQRENTSRLCLHEEGFPLELRNRITPYLFGPGNKAASHIALFNHRQQKPELIKLQHFLETLKTKLGSAPHSTAINLLAQLLIKMKHGLVITNQREYLADIEARCTDELSEEEGKLLQRLIDQAKQLNSKALNPNGDEIELPISEAATSSAALPGPLTS